MNQPSLHPSQRWETLNFGKCKKTPRKIEADRSEKSKIFWTRWEQEQFQELIV